jgi:hypothetical protein
VGITEDAKKAVPESTQQPSEVAIVTAILSQLSEVDGASRDRIINTVATFYAVSLRGAHTAGRGQSGIQESSPTLESAFSENRSISPKQFMFEKQARTDVEKVACLAYYLTHYADTPHFKTLDISRLNTEAAQVKFSNPAVAVENAVKRSYLVAATKGNKQLSAIGEQFVQALPDRDKAQAIMMTARPRRKSRKSDDGSED